MSTLYAAPLELSLFGLHVFYKYCAPSGAGERIVANAPPCDRAAAGPSDTAAWSLDISGAVGKRNIHEPINDAEILKQFGHTRAPSGAASL